MNAGIVRSSRTRIACEAMLAKNAADCGALTRLGNHGMSAAIGAAYIPMNDAQKTDENSLEIFASRDVPSIVPLCASATSEPANAAAMTLSETPNVAVTKSCVVAAETMAAVAAAVDSAIDWACSAWADVNTLFLLRIGNRTDIGEVCSTLRVELRLT